MTRASRRASWRPRSPQACSCLRKQQRQHRCNLCHSHCGGTDLRHLGAEADIEHLLNRPHAQSYGLLLITHSNAAAARGARRDARRAAARAGDAGDDGPLREPRLDAVHEHVIARGELHERVHELVPALEVETDTETLLITVDDDVRYPPEMVSAFQKSAQAKPDAAFGSRGFNFTSQGKHLQPVRGQLAACDVLQGYGACAYRRRHFHLEDLTRGLETQPASFRFSDDVLISNHIASLNVPRFTIELDSRLEHMRWGDEDPQSLKFVDGGTHKRYEDVRRWHIQENEWFAQGKTALPLED